MRSFLRFISRNKLYSAIEAVGLSVSLAFVIIIFCFVTEQMNIPRENPDYKNIYAMGTNEKLAISYGTKDALKGIPEIEKLSRFQSFQNTIVEVKDLKFRTNVLACDREYFDLFPAKFVSGDADMIDNEQCAFVSQKLANSIETDEVIGTKLIIDDQEYIIAGVISDFQNTLLPDDDVVVEISKFILMKTEIENPFNHFGRPFTFAKFSPNVDMKSVKNKVDAAYETAYGNGFHDAFFEESAIVRLDEVYFSSSQAFGLRKGDKSMINNLLAVGLLLLVSAIINYINLNVALTGKRAKEMASRRLVGAQKRDIVGKYLAESFAFTFICFLVGLGLAFLILPLVNQLMDAAIPISISLSFRYLCYYLMIVAVVSFLAGIMPALLISKARPIDVVNGKVRLHNKMFASKIFIVVQNVITIVLISLVLTMELQMRHVQNRDVGCRTKDLYFLDASFTLDPSHNEALANELQALPCVSRFGTTTGIPTKVPNAIYLGHLNDEEDEEVAHFMICDTAVMNMFEIPILSVFGDTTAPQGCFMTQSMLAGLTGLPYGEINVDTIVKWQQGNFGNEICGVVGDFMVSDVLHATNESFGMVMLLKTNFRNGFLMEIKGDHKEAKEAIGALYKKYVEDARGLYMEAACNDFVDVIIHQCLEKPQRRMRLMELFMLISVILSLLGLVAMSTHFASEREKTIAIRKIFGGTMESEIRKNLRDYVIIILIANVIAIPIGVWLCGKYLEDFAYRIDLHSWIFIVTVLISFAIAIGSVLWQIVSVAKVNPAEALKKE